MATLVMAGVLGRLLRLRKSFLMCFLSIYNLFIFVYFFSLFLLLKDFLQLETNGKPKPITFPDLLPNGTNGDRIPEQLAYEIHRATATKRIMVMKYGDSNEANRRLYEEKCKIRNCVFVNYSSYKDIDTVDAFLFNGMSVPDRFYQTRRPNQVWIVTSLEPPAGRKQKNDLVNWTATYRRDSTIVTPYERFVPYPNRKITPDLSKDYMANKTKMVAWFVSNCYSRNGRINYGRELGKYIELDIYGACGSKTCSRANSDKCYNMLKTDYKFYLAFENSNCKDYITEKLYWNAYKNDIIPVVMGARPEDYAAVAPPNSFIHVDYFSSPRALAGYLHRVANSRELYNSYFAWKGTGEFINTKMWCRLCSMVHGSFVKHTWYNDVQEWWAGDSVCRHAKDGMWSSWKHDPYKPLLKRLAVDLQEGIYYNAN